MTTPTKEMTIDTPEFRELMCNLGYWAEEDEGESDDCAARLIAHIDRHIAQARASLPNTAASPAVPAQQPGGAHLAAELPPATPVYIAAQVKQRILDLDAENAALHAQHDRAAAYIAELEAKLAATSVPAHQIGGSIDSQPFRDLVNGFMDLAEFKGHDEAACFSAWKGILAHIDAYVATKVQAARDEASQWISLKDARPADFQPVLVALSTGTVVVGMRASMGWHWDETDDLEDADATATHWMPIPRSPAATDAGEQQ